MTLDGTGLGLLEAPNLVFCTESETPLQNRLSLCQS